MIKQVPRNVIRSTASHIVGLDEYAWEAFERQTVPLGRHAPDGHNRYVLSRRESSTREGSLRFWTWWVDLDRGNCWED